MFLLTKLNRQFFLQMSLLDLEKNFITEEQYFFFTDEQVKFSEKIFFLKNAFFSIITVVKCIMNVFINKT